MNDLRKVKKLAINDKLMHYKWLEYHIVEVGDRVAWISGKTIYKHIKVQCHGMVVHCEALHCTHGQ